MSYILVPSTDAFMRMPVHLHEQLFAGAHKVTDRNQLEKIVCDLRTAAETITKNIKPSFSGEHLRDLETRPTIAVIADGATIHTNTLSGEQQKLQADDAEKAVAMGRALARKGWRVVLPGYTGLCESLIKGIREEDGQYIVVMTKRSLRRDHNDAPILPKNGTHGFYIVTNTLAESKSILFALSDSLVFFRGGLRTLDIFTDHFVLEQTSMVKGYRVHGDHRRKLILFNDDSFWQPVLDMTDHMIAEKFVDEKHRHIPHVEKLKHQIIGLLEEDFYPGSSWPAVKSGSPELFIPSGAITLAAELSRASVIRQIIPTTAAELKAALIHERKFAKQNGPLDPQLQNVDRDQFISVYCGSRDGSDPIYKQSSGEAGATLRRLGKYIIYGGSKFGNMGAVADGYLDADCSSLKPPRVLAVTPFAILLGTSTAANEGFHQGITLTIGVPGMQERKMIMTSLSRKSIVLSGGWGSLDETFEEAVLVDLDVTKRESFVLNVNGYWNGLPGLFEPSLEHGFTDEKILAWFNLTNSVPELEQKLLRSAEKSYRHAPALA